MKTPSNPLLSWTTILGGVVSLLCCAFLLLGSFLSSPAAGIPTAERALARVVGRTMQLREAAARIPSWERRLHAVFDPSLGSEEEFSRLIEWHREFVQLAKDPAIAAGLPVIMAHAGVLEGEAGRLDLLNARTERWSAEAPDPVPAYALLLRAAYFGEAAPRNWAALLQDLLPPDWFRDRLQQRIAQKSGDWPKAQALQQADQQAAQRLFTRYRALTAVDLALLLLFPAILPLFLRKPAGFWKTGNASIPLPWSFPSGLAVLIRGAGLGILLSFAWAFLPFQSHPAMLLVSTFLWIVPVLLLARHRLLCPNQLSLIQEIGLDIPLTRWEKPAVLALLGLGADSVGGWLIGTSGFFLHLPNHWAESFDPDLAFGSRGIVWISLIGTVLAGPFAEELVFRGLLYGTLRIRFGRAAAMLLSGLCFSLVHGYGLVGFLTVFWSGVVFAWIYEESGTLWPAIAVHALGNLLYALNVLAMLRLT